jgi:glycosyltransferase involved in cell wall biosynthesis
LKILWYNWRDIKHPDGGGAEVYTHEVASRLQNKGHDVTLFVSDIPSKKKMETIHEVKVIRDGGKFSVYRKAKEHYKNNMDKYDIIIDEINGRPFLTPTFVKNKTIIALFHQSIKEEWFYETSFPLNYVCYYYLEKKWMSYYKDVPTITVSNSSKVDLINSYGIKNVEIAPIGINIKPLSNIAKKETDPTIIFIGRLKRHKLPDHAIQAFNLINQKIPNAKLKVIGNGYLFESIKKKYTNSNIEFCGKLENETKYEILKKAHLVLVPSVREGWGLVVTESNAMGTPVIAYDVAGLRDSVINNKTGLLTPVNNPENLANLSINLLNNFNKLEFLSLNALEYARNFNWDITAEIFDRIIKREYTKFA